MLAQWSLISHSWDGPLHHLLIPGNALQWLKTWLACGPQPQDRSCGTSTQKTLSLRTENLKQVTPWIEGWHGNDTGAASTFCLSCFLRWQAWSIAVNTPHPWVLGRHLPFFQQDPDLYWESFSKLCQTDTQDNTCVPPLIWPILIHLIAGEADMRNLGKVISSLWQSLPVPNTVLIKLLSCGTMAITKAEMQLVPTLNEWNCVLTIPLWPSPAYQHSFPPAHLKVYWKSIVTYSSLVIGCSFQWSSSSSKKDLFIILLFSSRGIKFSIIRCL